MFALRSLLIEIQEIKKNQVNTRVKEENDSKGEAIIKPVDMKKDSTKKKTNSKANSVDDITESENVSESIKNG